MEYTEKLGFPIPQVTRGGDVNDVIDITNTIGAILEYIDNGSGDYNVGVIFENLAEQTVDGHTLTPITDIVGDGMLFPGLDGVDTSKIAWTPGGETSYAKMNTDGTILIKKAGNYNVIPNIVWTSADTDGDVALVLQRSDVQDAINAAMTFKLQSPITGDPLYAISGGNKGVTGVIGTHFYQEDAVITPSVMVTDEAASIEVQFISIAVERL